MKKGESKIISITQLNRNGLGVGAVLNEQPLGKVPYSVTIPYTAPGDIVNAVITGIDGLAVEAQLVSFMETSALRTEKPLCAYYGRCGGCQLGHISTDNQTLIKRRMIERLLRNDGSSVTEALAFDYFEGPWTQYRHRTQFSKNKNHEACFMARSSNTKIPIVNCPICSRAINAWLGEAAHALAEHPQVPERFTVTANSARAFVEGIDNRAEVSILGKTVRYATDGFFQSNLELLPELILEAVEDMEGAKALDLYSGAGLFGAFLADRFDKVACVEQSTGNSAWIRENVPGASVYALSVEDWTRLPASEDGFDYVVLDPPRNGLSKPVRRWLASKKAPALGYVSCNPETLVRDIKELCSVGYTIDKLQFFDFYPHTMELEAYARLVYGP